MIGSPPAPRPSVGLFTGRPGAIAAARVVNAAFFMALAAYCFLSYSPFAYAQFIKPNVVPELNDFVLLSPWLFWLVLLITTLTILPETSGARGPNAGLAYVVVCAAAGIWMIARPPLLTLGNSPRGLALGLLALVPPAWLAILDHRAHRPTELVPADRFRAFGACGVSALVAWAIYASVAPIRLGQAVGIDLPRAALAMALGSAFILDLFVFMAVFLALMTVVGAAGWSRNPARTQYWLFVAMLAACSTLVMYLLVCASIAFVGWHARLASAGLGVAVSAVWSDVAVLRSAQPGSPLNPKPPASSPQLDALALFSAPVAGRRSRLAAAGVLVVLPAIAYGLTNAVFHFDWNFLLQKLGVLMVWLTTFAAAYAVLRTDAGERRSRRLLAAVPIVALGLYHGLAWFETRTFAAAAAGSRLSPQVVLDRYASVDPSFRLIRDAQTTRSAETAEYYAYLRSHTLVSPRLVQPIDTDFVRPLGPAPAGTPHMFMFVVDSMRRDYLSPYNPSVTFTPEVAKLAADSFVFERAFTRYAGTALAVPSIWQGGMMIHMLEQQAFGRRDTLLKLLDANHYVRMMDLDHVVNELVPTDPNLVLLDRGKTTMQFDLCTTIGELEGRLASADTSRPVFFYSLPQNVHISIASHRTVPDGESYPGFFAPVASSLRRVDACLGGFVDFLKRTRLYDDSVIVLTSDHGDSLGEDGRWGHAYSIFPEVMRIPLIVHLPPWMSSRVAVDLSAVGFSSDLTPSLYALLGYTPADLGPLFGRPLFVAPDADASWRRRDPFFLASSYGAVYAMLHQNGRRMYVVDAVDGRDYAFDMGATSGVVGSRLEVTPAMVATNHQLIRERLDALAAMYHYHPQP